MQPRKPTPTRPEIIWPLLDEKGRVHSEYASREDAEFAQFAFSQEGREK